MSDIDLAVKNVIHSAFSNGGQKCSSTSNLIVEKVSISLLRFSKKLLDCALSYKSGPAWDLSSYYGPLISNPNEKLVKAINEHESNQYWLLEPRLDTYNQRILSPGIKWGVKRGSFMHKTELFGPILGVICAESLEDAIDISNDTGYGLTAGLESLDEEEQKQWASKIQTGNLYINRNTVGAVVCRQPWEHERISARNRY